MIYIESKSNDPTFNLALEQLVFEELDQTKEYLMLWQNDNSIIVGKNQNTLEEINSQFVKEHQIQVVRRLSGGGAVYHDMGNLNFTFITDCGNNSQLDMKKFSHLVADALKSLGVPAEVGGRNDILILGQKFSGNAQYIKKGRVMHHGTLMFRSDLSILSQALNVSNSKIESKGIKSVKSRVTNISEHLKQPMSLTAFKQHLANYLLSGNDAEIYTLTEQDMDRIQKLQKEVYESWEWNFGHSPKFSIKKRKRFEQCGEIEIRLDIVKGRISGFVAYGDFFGSLDTKQLSSLLIGTKLESCELADVLSTIPIGQYFNGLDKQEFIDLLLS